MSFNPVVTVVKIIVLLSHFKHLPFLSHLPCFRTCLVFTFALFTIASVFCSAVMCPVVHGDDDDEVLWSTITTKHNNDNDDDDDQARTTTN